LGIVDLVTSGFLVGKFFVLVEIAFDFYSKPKLAVSKTY